jgi:hypothetical protein
VLSCGAGAPGALSRTAARRERGHPAHADPNSARQFELSTSCARPLPPGRAPRLELCEDDDCTGDPEGLPLGELADGGDAQLLTAVREGGRLLRAIVEKYKYLGYAVLTKVCQPPALSGLVVRRV